MIQDYIILTRHFSFLVAPFEVLRYAVSLDLNEGIVVEEVISLDITFQALVQLLQILMKFCMKIRIEEIIIFRLVM